MMRYFLFLFLFVNGSIATEFRAFTDIENRQIEARPISVSEAGIVIEMRGGQRYTLPLERLSEADREFARAFVAQQSGEGRVWFPDDSGVIDVTQPPYGAIPGDNQDDTAAIQKALEEHPTNNHVFYFPNGVYDISDTLIQSGANQHACLELRGSLKRNIFIGETENGAVLRLMDSTSPEFSGGVIWFGPSPAQRFRNAMRNLTVSIGTGHPKASAVLFNASNQGGLRNVTLRSEDPEGVGAIGLHMAYTDEIGPLFVQHLTVEGFDRGIRTAWQTASQTFEHITLRNQREYGWTNGFSQAVFARGLNFEGPVTAVRSGPTVPGDPGQAKLLLIDAHLRYTGKRSDAPAAVRNQKAAFLRNIETDGFKYVVTRELDHYRGNPTVEKGPLEEFIANGAEDKRRGPPFKLFEDSADRSLNLPIEETPKVPWDQNPSNWAGPHQFGGKPDDAEDDTRAFQRAIDSGATTVYLPRGTWRITGELILRGKVRHLVGCEARFNPVEGETATVVLGEGEAPAVLVEGLEAGRMRFTHGSERTLHLRHLLGGGYEAPEAGPFGKVFLTDVTFAPVTIAPGQHLWARQLNVEGNTTDHPDHEAKLYNNGGTAWILGMKTEDAGTVIKTVNGGKTELLGQMHVGGSGEAPRFVTVDSSFSAALVTGSPFPIAAAETRNGETRQTENFNLADLYSAWSQH